MLQRCDCEPSKLNFRTSAILSQIRIGSVGIQKYANNLEANQNPIQIWVRVLEVNASGLQLHILNYI
jgi:hypothetical protein